MKENKEVLELLLSIFLPDYDWLGFAASKNNHYTYHHIIPERDGGKTTKKNGAILTKKGHEIFNYIEQEYPDIALELTELFKNLNETNLPATDDYYEEVDRILKKVNFNEKK